MHTLTITARLLAALVVLGLLGCEADEAAEVPAPDPPADASTLTPEPVPIGMPDPVVITDNPFGEPFSVFNHKVRKGQAVHPRLLRDGLSPRQALELVEVLRPLIDVGRRARPGDTYRLSVNDEGDVVAFDYQSQRGGDFFVRRQGGKLVAAKGEAPQLRLYGEDPNLQQQDVPENRDPGPGSPLVQVDGEEPTNPEEVEQDEAELAAVEAAPEADPEADPLDIPDDDADPGAAPEPTPGAAVEVAAVEQGAAVDPEAPQAPVDAQPAPGEAPAQGKATQATDDAQVVEATPETPKETPAQAAARKRQEAQEARREAARKAAEERRAAIERRRQEREDARKAAEEARKAELARRQEEEDKARAEKAREEKARAEREAMRAAAQEGPLPRKPDDLVRAYFDAEDAGRRQLIANALQRSVGVEGTRRALVRVFRPSAKKTGLQLDTIKVNGRIERFALYVPPKYKPGRAMPLHISLHGGGGNGPGSCQRRWGHDWPDDFILVCPTTPGGHWWSPQGEATVLAVYRKVLRLYNVQTDQVTVGGLSNGGTGTLHMATKFPWLWAAVVPRCPARFAYEHWYANMSSLPAFLIHGDHDQQIVPSNSRWIVEKLTDLGNKPEYIEVPGGGHDFFSDLNPKATRWFLPKKRRKQRDFTYIRTRGPDPEMIHWLSAQGAGNIEATITRNGNTVVATIKTERDPNTLKVYFPKDQIARNARVILNGREVYSGRTPTNARHVLESFAATGDLRRVYSGAVTVR